MRLINTVRDWLWSATIGKSTVTPTDGLSEAGKQKMYRDLQRACALLPACHMLVDARDSRLSVVISWSADKGPKLNKPLRFALNGVDKTVVVYSNDEAFGDNERLHGNGLLEDNEAFDNDARFGPNGKVCDKEVFSHNDTFSNKEAFSDKETSHVLTAPSREEILQPTVMQEETAMPIPTPAKQPTQPVMEAKAPEKATEMNALPDKQEAKAVKEAKEIEAVKEVKETKETTKEGKVKKEANNPEAQQEKPSKTAGTMQRLCRYLCAHYLFRYNLLTEQTEYAKIKEVNSVGQNLEQNAGQDTGKNAGQDTGKNAGQDTMPPTGPALSPMSAVEGHPKQNIGQNTDDNRSQSAKEATTENTEATTLNTSHHLLYQPIDERAMNGICLSAIQDGIDCWDRDVRRYLRSDRIESFHPFTQYLDTLPAWDGKDRVTLLAQRVSSDGAWTNAFHRWMLGMVAQWRGLDGNRANSVAPLLVSTEQGWGKSTFARTLLPTELRRYFTESFDLNAASSAEQKLALFGLINLDEYDKLPVSRQPLLKNLMQTSTLNIRRAYHQQSESLRRIASFIGTSNRRDLLTDPTGSRRFICVELEHPIDNSPLNYAQLYAQLLHELASGERYWFSKEEEAEIQRNNRRFYVQSPLEEVLLGCFTFCNEQEEGARLLSSADIYRELQRYNSPALRGTTCTQLSRLLPAIGRKVHTRYGNGYWVKKA